MTYAVVTVFTPHPEHRAALVDSLRRYSRVARTQRGLVWTGVVDDEAGRVVGTVVWESAEAARAAAPALRAEVGGDPFATWEERPAESTRGTVLEEGGRVHEEDDRVAAEDDDDLGGDDAGDLGAERVFDPDPPLDDDAAAGPGVPEEAGSSVVPARTTTTSASLRSTFLPVVRFRDGYDIEEVDAFLERVADALDHPGTGGDGLTPQEVATAGFTTTSLRRGYDVVAVDQLLGRLAGAVRGPRAGDVAAADGDAAGPGTGTGTEG